MKFDFFRRNLFLKRKIRKSKNLFPKIYNLMVDAVIRINSKRRKLNMII